MELMAAYSGRKGKDNQGPISPQGSQAPSPPPPLSASLFQKGLRASPYSFLSLTVIIWKMGVYQKKKGIGEIA